LQGIAFVALPPIIYPRRAGGIARATRRLIVDVQ
jgi:hypothetical protein